MDSRTTTSPPPTQVTQRNATTRRAMTTMRRRMRGRSPARTAHGDERPGCAQTGREFSPRPDRCQRILPAPGGLLAALALLIATVTGAIALAAQAAPGKGAAANPGAAPGGAAAAARALG